MSICIFELSDFFTFIVIVMVKKEVNLGASGMNKHE
jgi:hypothetical protein